jgi:hypothetical protein
MKKHHLTQTQQQFIKDNYLKFTVEQLAIRYNVSVSWMSK